MKLRLLNTAAGLKPMYDEDYDEKKKLKIGEVYEVTIKLDRNPDFHRKLFALVKTAWECLPERQTNGFRTMENFRKYLTVAAGFCDIYYHPRLKEWVEFPKSWSFEKMDNAEFEDMYNKILDVVLTLVSKFVSEDEFKKLLEFS
jgi:hypothetical protein